MRRARPGLAEAVLLAVFGWGCTPAAGQGSPRSEPKPNLSAMTSPTEPDVSIARVAAASGATCALTERGQAACWGAAAEGLVGNGQVYAQIGVEPSPVWVSNLHAVKDIDVGEGTAVALTQEGKLYTWGVHIVGRSEERFGRPLEETFWEPREGPRLPEVRSVATGRQTFFAVTEDGSAFGWGYGGNFVLGKLGMTVQSEPLEIEGMSGAKQVASHAGHSCALAEAGTVACWGIVRGSMLRELPTVELDEDDARVEGSELKLTDEGARKLWAAFADQGLSPVRGVTSATQLDTGSAHACALVGGGHIYCWGAGERMQLGDGKKVERGGPVRVAGIEDAVQVAAGGARSCALLRSGEVHCWGQIQKGDPVARPTRIDGLMDIVSIALGSRHGCAVGKGGALYCWGSNRKGQLGLGFVSVEEPVTRVAFAAPPRR